MDKVRKAFRQAPPDVARKVMEAYQCICAGDETGLDIKKCVDIRKCTAYA